MLQAAGLRVPDGELARTPDEAAAVARRIGYPVVLKAQSAALTHKTEAGGVALNIADEHALRAACQVQQEITGSTELVETVYVAAIEAVRGHGGQTAQWIAESTRRAHAVLNEMAGRGVQPVWAQRVRQVDRRES